MCPGLEARFPARRREERGNNRDGQKKVCPGFWLLLPQTHFKSILGGLEDLKTDWCEALNSRAPILPLHWEAMLWSVTTGQSGTVPLLIATGEAIPLRGLEGVPGLPGAPQDEAGLESRRGSLGAP